MGSAQWMSSTTSTSGRSRASASTSLPTAQNVSSSLAVAASERPRAADTSSVTRAASLPPPSPSKSVSSGASPAASCTISWSGQKVIPSPYGRQRPVSTLASSPTSPGSSRASRDLPIPARSQHGHEVRRAPAERARKRLAKLCDLPLSPDEGRVQPPRKGRRAGSQLGQPPRRRLFRLGGLQRLHANGVVHESARRLGDRRLAGRGPLGQAHGPGDDIRGEERLTRLGGPVDDLAGRDSRADADAGAERPLELVGERRQELVRLDRRAQRPKGVVLVQGRDPEDADQPLAREAGDRAAVALDDLRHRLHGARPDGQEGLRVEAAAGRRRVGEDEGGDRDRLPGLAARLGLDCRLFRGDGGNGRLEGGLLAEDLPLEPLQLGSRLDAELVDEDAACVLVGGQRLRLPARAVEGQHELAAEALAQRVLRGERLELADEVGAGAAGEVDVDAGFEGEQAQLLEAGDLGLRKGLVAEVGQGGAAPEPECLAQLPARRGRVAGGDCLPRAGDEVLEAVAVQLARLDPQEVARGASHERFLRRPESPPQPGDVPLERSPRGRRRLPVPELVHQPVGRDDLVRLQEEEGEDGALPRSAEGDRAALAAGLERPQDSEFHGPGVRVHAGPAPN